MKTESHVNSTSAVKLSKAILKNDIKIFRAWTSHLGTCYHFVKLKKNKLSGWKGKCTLILSGAVIGLLNGFFGGGGGMVCVPILEKVLSLDQKHSHATAIAVIFPISLISAFIYIFKGYLETFPLCVVGAGVVVGGVIGSFALKFLPPKALRIIFALIMLAGGIKLLL